MHYKWTRENTHWCRQTAFQERFSTNVWLGLLGTKVIGPYFYDGKLTARRYLNFLQNEFQDFLYELTVAERLNYSYFQQDGAPPLHPVFWNLLTIIPWSTRLKAFLKSVPITST